MKVANNYIDENVSENINAKITDNVDANNNVNGNTRGILYKNINKMLIIKVLIIKI